MECGCEWSIVYHFCSKTYLGWIILHPFIPLSRSKSPGPATRKRSGPDVDSASRLVRKSASAAASKVPVPILTLGPRCAGSGHVLYFGKGAVTGSLKNKLLIFYTLRGRKCFFPKTIISSVKQNSQFWTRRISEKVAFTAYRYSFCNSTGSFFCNISRI